MLIVSSKMVPFGSFVLASALLFAGAPLGEDALSPTEIDEPALESATPAATETVEPGDSTVGQAVILRINRYDEVAGHVESEDEETIVIRTRRDHIATYTKARLHDIIRLVEPQPGQRGVVFMRDGQTREGVVIEDTFDQVTVEIGGIRARIRREFVDRVLLKPTFEQLYNDFKASIGPRMYDRHLRLCQWLVEHREYELAEKELNDLLRSTPQEIPEAQRLLRVVEAQLAMRSVSAENAMPIDEESQGAKEFEPEIDRGRLLTRDEVNLMRVYEIDFEAPPRVSVKPETIRKMIENYSANEVIPASPTQRNSLFRADPLDIVRMLFQLRARELYGEVQVLTEPPAFNLFRQRVHNTWLLQNCATSGCHGGPDAGVLLLHRENHQDERVRYTNFLILERLDVDPDWPLINYENPEMSLIVQYAMPRDQARLPHPDVRGWRPVFTRPGDRMKRDTIRWIESMMRPRPDYPIDFEPPKPRKTAAADDENHGKVPR